MIITFCDCIVISPSKKISLNVRFFRFPSSFEDVRIEWQVRNAELAAKFLIDFGLESYEVSVC
jgi:hypothetical protein